MHVVRPTPAGCVLRDIRGGGGWLSGGRGPRGPCMTPKRGALGFNPLDMISLIRATAAKMVNHPKISQ